MFDQNHITRARARWINTNSTEIKCSVYELLVFIKNYREKRSKSNWWYMDDAGRGDLSVGGNTDVNNDRPTRFRYAQLSLLKTAVATNSKTFDIWSQSAQRNVVFSDSASFKVFLHWPVNVVVRLRCCSRFSVSSRMSTSFFLVVKISRFLPFTPYMGCMEIDDEIRLTHTHTLRPQEWLFKYGATHTIKHLYREFYGGKYL